ncbi:hypothetical protein [Saccharospirillum salsuginis]|uniref:Uncharacterized protein n=1 Tax=Saccharospirillum salsuginis TaxID=418750 RepID=A0A918K1B7_9GAMM|nr:hypothetical protein [Saccharospirillum salsuginis]GGX41426.1 hypothetical protein GCM10007392_05420 [Saccharospirillum salsuginis]
MENFHFARAKSQLKSRATWLTERHKHCEFDMLRGIEQKLYGHLAYLQEAMPEPDMMDEDNRILNLCITAFQPGFSRDTDRLGDVLEEAGVDTWLNQLQTAIDITGEQNWQPLLRALAAKEGFTDTTRWWFNARVHGMREETDASTFTWSNATPGCIPYHVKNRLLDSNVLEAWLPEARDSVRENDRADDLLWLALGLLAAGKTQPALELISLWTTSNSTSRSAWCAAAVSGAADFIEPLQQAVQEDHIPDFWLAVHGDVAHLELCIDRLARPNSVRIAERAWFGLTGQRLPRVRSISLGNLKKGAPLADARVARLWLLEHRPSGRLCLGQNQTDRPFRVRLGRYFGADTEPVGPAIWLDSQGRCLPNPNECHWQRAQRMAEGQA